MVPSTLPYLFKVSKDTIPLDKYLFRGYNKDTHECLRTLNVNVDLEEIHVHYDNIFSAKFEEVLNLSKFQFSFDKISER